MNNYQISRLELDLKEAFDLLPETMANICLKKDYFIALIRDIQFNPSIILIDTTRNIIFNQKDNTQITKGLIRKFSSYKKWYEC